MLRPNGTAINHLNVTLRKTRRHCMSDMVAVVAKQQYRAEHLWRLRLDHQHQVREDFAKRRVRGNHLHDALLLRAKFVILPSTPRDIRQGGRQFLSLRSGKFSLLLIGHLYLCSPRRLFYARYVTKAILRRQVMGDRDQRQQNPIKPTEAPPGLLCDRSRASRRDDVALG